MLSAAMTSQDQSGRSGSNTVVPICTQSSNEAGSHSMQCFSGDDHALKARKPYTITKQRERWTEEEHKKFLEALKLHGRAWRRIEEHVGTKTAVQIRSHAQKFFSKVVRESAGSDMNTVKPIEIPPPRPKRKPMHPYPRKVVIPQKGIVLSEQPIRSMSPNLSVYEQENQSPTSVFSVVGSDMGSADSGTPNGSLSPVSSGAGVNLGTITGSDFNPSPEENMFSSDVELNDGSSPDEEQEPTRLELFGANNGRCKEGSGGEASTRSLKLFGKIVLVTDSQRPSSPPTMPSQVEVKEFSAEQPSPSQWNFMPYRAPNAIYYMSFQNENLPSPAFYGGISIPFIPFLKPAENPGKELHNHKEGSLTGSNMESTTEDRTWDTETQSQMGFQLRLSEKLALSPEKCTKKGFVPYKRCFAERDTHYSSTITGEEREEQRMRLCL